MQHPSITTLAAALLALGVAWPAAAATVESRFDADAEGWTLRDLFPPQGGGQAPDYVAVGMIGSNDKNPYNVFSAPGKFLGNLTSFAGGSVSFDLSDTVRDGDVLTALYPTLVLRSGSTLLGWFGGPPGTAMTSFSATLAASSAWLKAPATFGPPGLGMDPRFTLPVSAADFSAVLGAVDGLYVNADWKFASQFGGPNDYAQLDNVRLAAAVPEPAGAAMLAAGLLVLAGLTRRRCAV